MPLFCVDMGQIFSGDAGGPQKSLRGKAAAAGSPVIKTLMFASVSSPGTIEAPTKRKDGNTAVVGSLLESELPKPS